MFRHGSKSSGLLCNKEKSHRTPMQIGEWLGFVIDSISMSFWIPEKKVSKLKGMLDSAIQAGYSSFRELARIAGFIYHFSCFGSQPDLSSFDPADVVCH